MNDERWRQVEDLFHEAAGLEPAERAVFLERACAGDGELRREVESLLAHDAPKETVLGAAVGKALENLPQAPSGDDLIGRQIGTYVITELIGKGGMGMVFKARDTRLNRSVAIKALAAGCFADADRKRRFLQEAESASALNHANIVTVYGMVEAEGADFLIMEYVSGKTLDRLIPRRRGLPLREALRYALEIADGLAVAHAAGFVHRDIKPANIMVTEQGRVKILDFGLAKHTKPVREGGETSAASALPSTLPGLILGTADYMSPEQAEGKPADARSDIFSFGALFYEMITGRRAFQGENVITILSAVINEEPPAVRKIAANAPQGLERIVARCLKKDPASRIQLMLDVRLALEDVLEEIESPAASPVPAKRRPDIWQAFLIVALGLALGVWVTNRILYHPPLTFRRLTFRHGDVPIARFAPGGTVVYAARWEGGPLTLFSAQPGNPEARELGLPPAQIFSISPSGEMLLGLTAGNTLARVPLGGGVPRELLENVSSAAWDPEGKAIAVVRSVDGRHRVEYPIGAVLYEAVTRRAPQDLRVSPRGDLVAFFGETEVGDQSLTLAGPKRPRRVLSKGWRVVTGLAWSPDGKEIWFGGGRTGFDPALYAVNLSGRERLLAQFTGLGVLNDVAKDGRLLLSVDDSRLGIRCLAPTATAERDLGWLDASALQAISNDGKRILFAELSSGEGRNPAIYLRPTDGSAAVRLGYGSRASLSADGKSVLCIRQEGNDAQLLLLPTGAGEARTLPGGGIRPVSVEWFPDSQRALVIGSDSNPLPRTYVKDLRTGDTKPVTGPGVRATGVSPDGELVVVVTSGKIYLHSIETGAETAVGPVDAGEAVIRWSGDGQHIFLQRNGDSRVTILRLDVRTGRKEVWRDLKPPDPGSKFFGSVKLSEDGNAYAFSFQRDLSTLYLVNGVR
jgi:serine/threonine protein kinase/Tol biopolymer transport system component